MRLRPSIMKGSYFYAVANGRQTGVFSSWDECRSQVNGFPKAKFKKFDSYNAAECFVNENSRNIRNNRDSKVNRGLTKGRVEKAGTSLSERGSARSLSRKPIVLSDVNPSGINYLGSELQRLATNNLNKLVNKFPEFSNDTPPYKDMIQKAKTASSNSGVHYIYCDGASKNNGKPNAIAGYGVFFGDGDPRNVAKPLLGKVQTNQRAELSAILLALQIIHEELCSCESSSKTPTHYHIKTDSKYSINCILNWSNSWIKNSWRSSKGEPVRNSDLIKQILEVLRHVNQKYDIFGLEELKLSYVPGHSGDYGNDQADALANTGVRLH